MDEEQCCAGRGEQGVRKSLEARCYVSGGMVMGARSLGGEGAVAVDWEGAATTQRESAGLSFVPEGHHM